MLADVIVMVVDGITTQVGFYLPDAIAMVADGITTGQLYFNFSSEMFNRTSFHMCGRWNLPTFLFKEWIISSYVNSFFDGSEEVLVLPCPYAEIFNRNSVTRDVNVVHVLVRGP